jgi:Xaa-Pro aminopeptidase
MNPKELKPQLSLEEKERRWSLVRKRMVQEGLAAVIVYGNDRHKRDIACRYLTNMLIFPPCEHLLIFPIGGPPILLVTMPENFVFAKMISWIAAENIYESVDLGVDLVKHLTALKLEDKRVGIDNPKLWQVQEYLALKESCPKIKVVEVTRWLSEMRAQKSSEEIHQMENAVRIGELVQRAFLAHLKTGMKEEAVVAKVEEVARSNGVEKRLWLMNSTPEIPWPWVPGKTIIKKPNPVVFSPEFAMTEGYACQVIRTYCWEEPKGEFKRMWELCGEMRHMVPNEFRPGRRIGDVAAKVENLISEFGFEYFNMGHGLGLHFFEEPPIRPGIDWTIMPNEVYVFHPLIRSKGGAGPMAWVGDMYLVGEGGTRWLTPFLPGLPEMIPS